jgi:hypothetical protein
MPKNWQWAYAMQVSLPIRYTVTWFSVSVPK